MKKLFISHASEDKDDFVRPLAEALAKDFEVWYDEYQLVTGCSILEEISKGLANCDFGVVVLSPHFFAKNWPQQELNGLFALENKDRKVILPIWKDVDRDYISKFSPILADRKASLAKDGISKVVDELQKAVSYFDRGRAVEMPSDGINKMRAILQKEKEQQRSESLLNSVIGVQKVFDLVVGTIDILIENLNTLILNEGYNNINISGPFNEGNHYYIEVNIGNKYLHFQYYNNIMNSAQLARLSVIIVKGRYDQYSTFYEKRFLAYFNLNNRAFWIAENDSEMLTPEELVNLALIKFAGMLNNN